jgi:hypothetical protein
MGRPLQKKYFGNTTLSGQTIQGNAWVNGDTMARPSYIVRQIGTGHYYWRSVDGKGPALGGPAVLVDGEISGPGQSNIKIYALGSETGSGAAAVANVGVQGATVAVNSTGSITADYLVNEVLHVQGGTYTGNQQANLQVTSTLVSTIQTNNQGRGYVAGDYFFIGGAGWTSNANVRVNGVNGAGSITSLSIMNSGSLTGTKPAEPITPIYTHTSGGSGATFDVRMGVNTLSVVNAGDYRAIPSSPVSLTGSAAGTGATANLTYYISSTKITNSGANYSFEPTVVITPDLSANIYAQVSGGHVSALVIDQAGTEYTSIPTLTFADSMATTHVRVLNDLTVRNWENQTYQWLTEGNTLPGPGWAHIETH